MLSCNNEKPQNKINSTLKEKKDIKRRDYKNANTKNDDQINLDFFKSIPDTLDGCLYTFNYDSISLPEKHILLSNGSNINIIKINNKEIYLNKDTINTKQISNSFYKEVYFNNEYKLILNIEELNSIDETSLYKGTLEISNKKFKKRYKIKGEGGC